MRVRTWRCAAEGCRDFLTVERGTTGEGTLYLAFCWEQGQGTLRERARRIWRIVTGVTDDWYEFAVADPVVAREMAALLIAGAEVLEREDG